MAGHLIQGGLHSALGEDLTSSVEDFAPVQLSITP